MTDEKLAELEHITQLLIFQLKSVHKHIGKAWFDLEVARSDLRVLMEAHEKWEKEQRLKDEKTLH